MGKRQLKSKHKAPAEPKEASASESHVVGMRVLGTPEHYHIGVLANVQFGNYPDKRVAKIDKTAGIVRVVYHDGTFEEFGRAAVSLFYDPVAEEGSERDAESLS